MDIFNESVSFLSEYLDRSESDIINLKNEESPDSKNAKCLLLKMALTKMIAENIYNYKKDILKRADNDERENYFIAQYFIKLYDYLRHKGLPGFIDFCEYMDIFKIPEVSVKFDLLLEEKSYIRVKDMVINIKDRAYFIKKEHPEYSDLFCFDQAERDICKEKEIDYIAYFEYLERIRTNSPGDEKSDYYKAETKYLENMAKRELAYFFWQKTADKNLKELDFWERAEYALNKLYKIKNTNDIRDIIEYNDKITIKYSDEIIDMVISQTNRIYNNAYFKNLAQLCSSKEECFILAEKEISAA